MISAERNYFQQNNRIKDNGMLLVHDVGVEGNASVNALQSLYVSNEAERD